MKADAGCRVVNCPICGKPVEWRPESRFRPFCSERCRQIDLGAWAAEEYSVPGAAPDGKDGGGIDAGPDIA